MIPVNDTIPTERRPLVTAALVLANLVVYVLAVAHGGSLISGPDAHELTRFGAIPHAFTHPGHHGLRPWVTVFTAMFLHASIVQLLVNLLFLMIFGSTVEDACGSPRFLALYIVGGIAAVALGVAFQHDCAVPTVGAGGAIASALGAYIVISPRARVLTLSLIPLYFTVIEVPAAVLVVVWFAVQAAFAALTLTDPIGGGGGFAYVAHVGGFLFGVLAAGPLVMHRRPTPPAAAVTP